MRHEGYALGRARMRANLENPLKLLCPRPGMAWHTAIIAPLTQIYMTEAHNTKLSAWRLFTPSREKMKAEILRRYKSLLLATRPCSALSASIQVRHRDFLFYT